MTRSGNSRVVRWSLLTMGELAAGILAALVLGGVISLVLLSGLFFGAGTARAIARAV